MGAERCTIRLIYAAFPPTKLILYAGCFLISIQRNSSLVRVRYASSWRSSWTDETWRSVTCCCCGRGSVRDFLRDNEHGHNYDDNQYGAYYCADNDKYICIQCVTFW